jgi:hypothetical protein
MWSAGAVSADLAVDGALQGQADTRLGQDFTVYIYKIYYLA